MQSQHQQELRHMARSQKTQPRHQAHHNPMTNQLNQELTESKFFELFRILYFILNVICHALIFLGKKVYCTKTIFIT